MMTPAMNVTPQINPSNQNTAKVAEQFVGSMMTQFAQLMFEGVNNESFEQEMFTTLLAESLGKQLAAGPMMNSLKQTIELKLNGGEMPVEQNAAQKLKAYEIGRGDSNDTRAI